MSSNSDAAKLADRYELVRKYAAAKAWRKWKMFILATPVSIRPFDSEDIDQWALEGILILGGFLPGSGHGKLAEFETKGERLIQHCVDLHISAKCQRAIEKFRAGMRGGGKTPTYLDTPVGDGERTVADILSGDGLETSAVALPDVASRYPLLWMTKVEGVPDKEARESLGMNPADFNRERAEEARRLYVWATRAHRVISGCKPPHVARECPYRDPACTGYHDVGRVNKDKACPSAWARKLERQKLGKHAKSARVAMVA